MVWYTKILCGILLVLAISRASAQQPHGEEFKISCDACHTSENWTVITDSVFFNHDTTTFLLDGQHAVIDCRQCHTTLEFARAESNCTSCHLDIHQQSVGDQCSRCHDSNSWIVNNITELHRQVSFPLQGAHVVAECWACHKSDTELRFDPLGTDCFACHEADFAATTNPNHTKAGFSTNCIECHNVDAFEWEGTGINHDFFPLTEGHAIDECAQCHTGTDYSKVSTACITCHEGDYLASLTPNHQVINMSTDCAACHTTNVGWQPAEFKDHDAQYFPIYSGSHKGEWDNCAACHTDPANYTIFTCITCHENPETEEQHNEVAGYSYNNIACLACHPNGENDGAFDHNNTNFPLTGEHTSVECLSCHTNGFTGTPTACFACHNVDFEQSSNPDHKALDLSTDCAICHTTTPEWNPATFANHNDFYLLSGAHAIIANDCASCHNGDYTNTPTTCIGCHQKDYDQTTDPSHAALSISTDCATCHTESAWTPVTFDHNAVYVLAGAHATIANQCAACHENGLDNTPTTCAGCHQEDYDQTTTPSHSALQFSSECISCHNETAWVPATFDHDNQYFPIYSGAHEGEWDNCTDCHTTPNDYSVFTCTTCHANPETDEQHNGISGYTFNSTACLACHPTGDGDGAFDHNSTDFPLTGGHTAINCLECHASGYEGTPTACEACHATDFNQTVNPNHSSLGFTMECASCHTTQPGWRPATLDNHNAYFVLTGGHADIATECASCHQGDYTNTPTTCAGCHQQDFEQTVDPPHLQLQFSNDCASCHTERGWTPATFDHDNEHFPIYSGSHDGQWDQCAACHTAPGDYSLYTCTTCHANPETDEQHSGINGYVYNSSACLACHPTGEATGGFDHSATAFPLTGAHTAINCLECHAGGYAGTPTACEACHIQDYNQSANPNHTELALSTSCGTCHTTEPGWSPASFDIHNEYYVLNGAHAAIQQECVTCHNGDYSNTPNTCAGCHLEEYNETTDPPHITLQFSLECSTCHSETAWEPSTFDHDGQYFPIYSGTHEGEWSECVDCHTTPGNYAVFTCTTCHVNPETNDQHQGINGYIYESTACLACHPTGDAQGAFDHDQSNFPLTGAHQTVDCIDCHSAGYENTPTECNACHMPDFNQSTNPNHNSLGLSTECATCHTTVPDWNPAAFPNHDDYYVLQGAHAAIADECITCHNGDYNNTPNTCVGCHQSDYNNTTNPSHIALNFPTECASCHTQSAWEPAEFGDHDDQYFPIYSGEHQGVWDQCTECHTNTNNYAIYTCVTCHTSSETNDQHQGINGYIYESTACLACHPTGDSEGAFDHDQSNFPLTGAHQTVDCIDCHSAGYENTPTECNACHMPDFNQSTNPNHNSLGLSTECATCHTTVPDWNPAAFPNHDDYYVLQGAHAAIADECITCHNGDYNNTPNTCVGCHQSDYNNTTNPSHIALNFPTECASCHTQSAWEPAEFGDHDDQYFPIYSGEHQGVWDQCTECHTNTNNYAEYTCVTCHTNAETNDQHQGINGYIYESTACLACHPTGDSEGAFDHDQSNFPLTGAHQTVDCIDCHSAGYENTPTECNACHMPDFNQSTNPNHNSLGLSTECATCHTTVPDWNPAAFPNHDDYYVLQGAHAAIADECITCHNGDYNNTPNTCVGCHQSDYNNTTNPSHIALNFPTECASCHTQSAWEPAEFGDHDDQYFPIYSGEHQGVWDQCTECHTNTNNYAIYTCVTCHTSSETSDQHQGINGYIYESTACLACHPTGDAQGAFDHDQSNFPLTGAHQTVDCIDCHSAGYENTPTECNACHMPDFNQSTNPNHNSLGLSTECATCHTTVPDWNPAAFPNHDDYYVLQGAHAAIANECITCHNGDYNNTPNTCVGCHQSDYNNTTNPSHIALNFPTECASCHTQSAWEPAEFADHDDQYFPIYSGEHQGVWDECTECHTNTNNYAIYTCVTCHTSSETNDQHQGINGYIYESTACLACHPTGDAQGAFDHDQSNFPLTGAHQTVDCIDCHSAGYENTPTECNACHMPDFNQSTNPNHNSLGLSTECATCHTTVPDWNPAAFPNHDDYYVLQGAHAAIADECVTCHNGNYNNTPNTCYGCHQSDYNQTNDPDHQAAQFPTTCQTCHTQNAWEPANWNHDDLYFPIYSGEHEGEWDQCTDCHTNPNNYSIFSCLTCHDQNDTDDDHNGVNGYQYNSNACLACHPDGEE